MASLSLSLSLSVSLSLSLSNSLSLSLPAQSQTVGCEVQQTDLSARIDGRYHILATIIAASSCFTLIPHPSFLLPLLIHSLSLSHSFLSLSLSLSPPQSLPKLGSLDVSYNSLTSFFADVTVFRKHTPNLTTLDTRHNPWMKV